MRYPTDYLLQSTYPIKCWSGFSDGFSGWYAVSEKRRCKDYCYWEIFSGNNDTDYTSTNVADPHQTTFLSTIDGTSSWRCALDVASDISLWSDVESKLTRPGYFGTQFPFLQCSRGANEVLDSRTDLVVQSEGLWWSLAILGSVLVLFQFMQLFSAIRTRLRINDQSGGTSHSYSSVRHLHHLQEEEGESADDPMHLDANHHDEEELVESEFGDEPLTDDEGMLIADRQSTNWSRRRRAFMFLTLNIGIVAALTMSIASLIDIRGKRMMSSKAMRLTPKCYNPHSECIASTFDIYRPSKQRKTADSTPFSYLVASDSQLDWFDGESPDIGKLAIPKSCSATDSCSSCSAKVGTYTNEQMRTSVEKLMNDKQNEPDGSRSNLSSPKPKTLVLNGDLTAYYHPHERSKYESIYHNIEGLQGYFPSLGNHDIDHFGGAMYGTDQWVGSPYCNSRHALGYLRSGICGHIPKFDPSRILRYDAASLAYSWEEGRYHFVHAHYFPAYESAGIGLKSSIAWLDRDVSLAYKANLTTILFVHASQGLNGALESVLLGRNVAAIFAGHSHRCLMRKCVAPAVIYENQIGNSTNNTTSNSSKSILPPDSYDECLPGTTGVCGGYAGSGGMSLYYLQNISDDFIPPPTQLFYEPPIREDRKLCPAPRQIAIVNSTKLLCRRAVMGDSDFPPRRQQQEQDNTVHVDDKGEHIPIFWSGSASFQTFLKVDFFEDRFTINAITAMEGMEGRKYIDTHTVPNIVYPYHARDDMEEVTVNI